jgi:phosphoglycolate phosphatase
MQHPYTLIALDLDGTLVDSAPDVAFAVDSMLVDLGREPLGVERVRGYIGNGVEVLAKRALTGQMWAEPPEPLYAQAMERLLLHYAANNGKRSTIYPGVTDTLQGLKAAGLKVCCVTNKKRQFTDPLLDDLGLSPFFDRVVCGDDLPHRKPHPLPLWHAMQASGASSAETIMVGDSVTDVKTARAAGVKVAAVSYGYNHGQDIRAAEPDWVIDSFTGICTILRLAA